MTVSGYPMQLLYYKFNEASGTLAIDSSGEGHNGTLVNGVTRTFGPAGMCRALTFNGVDQYLDTGTQLPTLQVPFSISFWTKPGATQPIYTDIVGSYGLHSSWQGFVLQMNSVANSLQFAFNLGVGTGWRTTAFFGLTASMWQHVAIVVESTAQDSNGLSTAGQIKVYLNGKLLSTAPYTGSYSYPAGRNLQIGHGHATAARYYSGAVDEVKFMNGALSASEVASLAQMGDMWVHYEFNEASGNTTKDLSGSCHTGQFKNGATRAAGLTGYGNALSLAAASNQFLDTGTNFPFMKEPFTVAVWVKPSATMPATACVAGWHELGWKGWVLQMQNVANSNNYHFAFGNGAAWSAPDPWFVLTPGQWHHITGTLGSGYRTVYVNGTTIGTATFTGTYVPPTNNVVIGNGNTDYCQPFNGLVDSFRIYSNGLSSGEILQLYKTNNDTMPKPPAVWLSYKFDEASGAVAVDSSGQGHNGTLMNDATRTFGPAGLCRAVSFNGVDQYIDTGTKLPGLTVPFSVALWIKPRATQHANAEIVGQHINYHGFVFEMDNIANSLDFRVVIGTGAWLESGSVHLAADIWHHIAFVVESTAEDNNGISTAGVMNIYHNGVLAVSTAYNGKYSYETVRNNYVGHGLIPASFKRFFNGAVDELQIFSGVLTASKVKSMAQMGDMWVHYEFNEASGNTTKDLSGSCHTGQFKNGATRAAGLSGSGNALSLAAASNQYVDTGTNFPSMKGAFTIALWVKPSVTNLATACMAGWHELGFKGWVLQMQGLTNSNNFHFAFGTGAAWVPSKFFMLAGGQWSKDLG